jgi:hypothetical protein
VAKRLTALLLIGLLIVLLLPGLGMAMVMEACPLCDVPSHTPIGAVCLAVMLSAIVLLALDAGRPIRTSDTRGSLGPPGPRLFHPPRSF